MAQVGGLRGMGGQGGRCSVLAIFWLTAKQPFPCVPVVAQSRFGTCVPPAASGSMRAGQR